MKSLRYTAMCLVLCVGATVHADDDLDALFADDAGEQSESSAGEPDTIVLPEEPELAPRPEPSGRPQIEEIVVTAQKREQSLADVPISVTAVSGEKLADAGIENITDLSEYTPNLKLVDSGLIPNIFMRGVGSGSNQGFEMSVGIFADGIHLGRPHQTRAAFMDLERAEVLRGPQSILFGKNAIAGALNLVAARPGEETEVMLGTTLGLPLESQEYNLVLSTPLTPTFGVRLAARHRAEDGYLYNELLERTEPGLDETSGRLTLDWAVSDAWGTTLKLEQSRREQRGRTFQVTHPGAMTRCTGENVRLDNTRVGDATELAVIDAYNATLTLAGDLGPGQLDLVTGYSGFDSSDLFDADSSSFDTLALLGVENYDQLSQEIRFTVIGDAVDVIAGVFYQKGDLSFYEFGPTVARTGGVRDAGSCELNTQVLAEADLERDFLIDSSAWSIFTQLTWYVSEPFHITTGLRWVLENKDGYRRFSIFEPGTRQPANPASQAALDQLLINEHELDRQREVDILLPSLNLQYAVTEDGMAYLAFTRGAKSGSYDARNNNGNTDAQGGATRFEFDDEVADAFELGSKLRLLGGQADLNAALYWVDYQDMQVSVYDGVAGFTVTNAGSARVRGLELDARYLATENTLFTASVAWLDFEWTDYTDGPCYFGAPNEDPDTGTCDLTGRENLQTPRFTAALGAQFDRPVGLGKLLGLSFDVSYRDAHFTSGDLDPRGRQPAHFKYNARLALSAADGRWSVGFLGKNIGDEQVFAIGAPTALDVGGYRVTTEPLSTYQFDLRWRF